MAEEIIGIKVTTDTAQATQDMGNFDKKIQETDGTVKGLRTQLKEAQAQVGLMADKFGATSIEAVNAAKKAADLKDRIGDAAALTATFNPDAKFKAVAGALSGVAGGFSAVQGIMAIFGKESTNVQAALLKVNAAMALSQGLNSLGDSIDSFKNLGTQIKSTTAFQSAYNFIIGKTAVSKKLETAATLANNAAIEASEIATISSTIATETGNIATTTGITAATTATISTNTATIATKNQTAAKQAGTTQLSLFTTAETTATAATKLQTAATAAGTIATTASSAAMKLLRAALIATGIGALVAALGAVIANFDAISDWIKKSPLGALAKGIGSLVEGFTDFIGVTSEAERNLNKLSGANKRANEDITNKIKLLKAQGGSEKEIYIESGKLIENQLSTLRESLKVKGNLTIAEQKQFRDLNTDKLVLTADYNKKTAEATAKANEKAQKDRDEANKKGIADTETANKMLIDLQGAKSKAILEDGTAKALKQLEIDKTAKDAEIEQLKVSQKIKDELLKLNNEKFDANKTAIDKKAKEDLDKKQKEEQDNLDKFNEKITDIKIAAIKNDDERAEATRLAKLKKELTELDADKEFIKLSEEDKAKVKKDLIDASEAEGQKSKNEIVKKGLQDELEILQAQQKGIEANSEAYFNNVKEIERVSYELKIAAAKGNAKEIEKINKEHSINNIAIEKAEKEAKKAILLERFKAVENFGKDLQVLAGKNKDLAIAGVIIEKAAAIGQVVVNTVAATSKAVAASPLTLGLPWSALIIAGGIAQTALIVKSGIEQIKQIKAAGASLPSGGSIGDGGGSTPDLGAGGGGGGALPDTGGGSAPDTGGDGGGSRRAPSGGGGGGSVRAYVIQTDINNAQQREQEIQNRARFQ